jgi:hypothetical protein
MFSIKSVEFHGFEIPGIPGIWRNSANFVTRSIPPKLGLPRENGRFFQFHGPNPKYLAKGRENAQLEAASIIRENRPSCCGAYRGGFI